MEEKLRLNNGTEILGDLIEEDGKLFLYMTGISLVQAFNALKDPDAAMRITAAAFGQETVYSGYSHLSRIGEENGGVNAVMTKAVSNNG